MTQVAVLFSGSPSFSDWRPASRTFLPHYDTLEATNARTKETIIFNHMRSGEPKESRAYVEVTDGANCESWLSQRTELAGRWGWEAKIEQVREANRLGEVTNLLCVPAQLSRGEALFCFASYLMAMDGDARTSSTALTTRSLGSSTPHDTEVSVQIEVCDVHIVGFLVGLADEMARPLAIFACVLQPVPFLVPPVADGQGGAVARSHFWVSDSVRERNVSRLGCICGGRLYEDSGGFAAACREASLGGTSERTNGTPSMTGSGLPGWRLPGQHVLRRNQLPSKSALAIWARFW